MPPRIELTAPLDAPLRPSVPGGLLRAVGVASLLGLGHLSLCPEAQGQELRYSPPVDLGVTLGAVGAWAVSERLRGHLVPAHCRWCDRDSSGNDTLNALDRTVRQLRWGRHNAADALSDVTAFVVTPLAAGGLPTLAAGHDGRLGDFGANTLVIAEAGALAADVNQLVKFLAVRERPDAHARELQDPGPHVRSVDDDLSFYSGHTTEAVSLAVAAGTVSSLRGYRLAPLVWGATLPVALFTGYLRIAADRHYFTDVLTGAVGGAIVGFVVPYVFHRPEAAPTTKGSAPAGQAYSLGFSGIF
jgi:membrane-associated phospholipid phosphatase